MSTTHFGGLRPRGRLKACLARALIAFAAITALLSLRLLPSALSRDDAPVAAAQSITTGRFSADPVVQGLDLPMAFAFAPDGRIFIAEKGGAVRIFKNGALLPTPFIQLTVNTTDEHGLIGMVLDPNFASNGFVYLFYTYENNPADPTADKTGQVIRVTATSDVAAPASEVVLLGSVVGDPLHPSCEDFPLGTDCIPADGDHHVAGGMRFAPDGTLFIATGDASPHGSLLSLRSQELDSLAGKIIRINTDGSAPANNPFYNGDPSANRSKVWDYGLRNPFRFGVQPTTGLPVIADVGSDFWEEIDLGTPGSNFGWPCYEGTQQLATYSSQPVCQALYAAGTASFPIYSYAHGTGAASIGGLFYQGTSYPPEFQNAFLFADHVRNTVSVLKLDRYNNLIPSSVTTMTGGDGLVDFEIGPGGDVYYASLGTGEVRHLRFVPAAADCSTFAPRYSIGIADHAISQIGTPSVYNYESADPTTGTAVNISAVQAADVVQGQVTTWGVLADSLYAGGPGTLTLTSTANFDGGILASGGSAFSSAQLQYVGVVIDGSTGAPVAAQVLRSDSVTSGGGGGDQMKEIHASVQSLSMPVTVPHSGMYTWIIISTSAAAAAANVETTMSAWAAWQAQLQQLSACAPARTATAITGTSLSSTLRTWKSLPFHPYGGAQNALATTTFAPHSGSTAGMMR